MCCVCLESDIFLHLLRADRVCLQSRAEGLYTCFCMYQELGMYHHVFVCIIMCEPVSETSDGMCMMFCVYGLRPGNTTSQAQLL
jgi:hypothetical protein